MTDNNLRDLLIQTRQALQASIDRIDAALHPSAPSAATTVTNDLPPEQVRLTGKVGRPSFKTKKEIAIWEAGLQITNVNGEKEWINVQAWRKTAIFARDNYPSAATVTAVGKWKHEEWSDERGDHDRNVFVITYFEDQE